MKKFTHFDDTFNVSHTNNYEVTIQFGRTGYAFCVNSLLNNKCVALGAHEFGGTLHLNDLPQRLSSFLDSQDFLSKNFSKVNFIYTSAKSTLVPVEHFKKEKLRELYSFNHILDPDSNLEYLELKNLKAYQVFAFPASLATIMVNRFKDVTFCHQSTALLDVFTMKATQKEVHSVVLVHFSDDVVDVIVSKQQKLLMHNSFEAASDMDKLYYVLYVYKQMGFQTKNTQLQLSGRIKEADPIYSLLTENITNYKFFAELNKTYTLETPKHELANLVNF